MYFTLSRDGRLQIAQRSIHYRTGHPLLIAQIPPHTHRAHPHALRAIIDGLDSESVLAVLSHLRGGRVGLVVGLEPRVLRRALG